jgi:uncharacterized protein YkwD
MKKIAFLSLWFLFALFVLFENRETIFKPSQNLPHKKAEIWSEEQNDLLKLHNEHRKSHGAVFFEMDEALCTYAQKHAEYMAKKGRLVHSSMSELQDFCGANVVGENIAWGQENPNSAVSGWMWSPMHRWNILGSSYRKVGFGVKKDDDGRKYWCAVFSS